MNETLQKDFMSKLLLRNNVDGMRRSAACNRSIKALVWSQSWKGVGMCAGLRRVGVDVDGVGRTQTAKRFSRAVT